MIQPLGPSRIWQKLSSFLPSEPTSFDKHFPNNSSLDQQPSSPNHEILSGVIGKNPMDEVAPLSPFGPHAEINGVPNLFGPLSHKPIKPSGKYQDLIMSAAQKAGVDVNLFDALVSTESDYRPNLISKAGAVGLAQLMPETAYELGVIDPFNPEQNLNGGAQYLSQMLKRFDGNIENALAAYNAGPSAVKRYGGIPPYEETQNYVKKILQKYRR